jgi:hypothetical protein
VKTNPGGSRLGGFEDFSLVRRMPATCYGRDVKVA